MHHHAPNGTNGCPKEPSAGSEDPHCSEKQQLAAAQETSAYAHTHAVMLWVQLLQWSKRWLAPRHTMQPLPKDRPALAVLL